MTRCRWFFMVVLLLVFVPHCAYCAKASNTEKNKQTSKIEKETTTNNKKSNEKQTNAENLLSQLKKSETGKQIINSASLGAVGIGGQMISSGFAEKMSDEESARDMEAYQKSMYCIVGNNGERVSVGSEYELQLADSDFKSLRDEYIATLKRLKQTREALGLEVGPEYNLNFDKDGLYEYQHTEQQKLMDTASERVSKSEADEKIEKGAIAAIAGIVAPYVNFGGNTTSNNKSKTTNKSGTSTGGAAKSEEQKLKKECEQACKQNKEVATKYGCKC